MFIRQQIGEKKKLSLSLGIALVIVAAVVLCIEFWPKKRADLAMAYYTDNDGQTWFSDSAYQLPPFDHNGKVAVRAQIFTYDSGSKEFCGYLQKYTPEAKQKLQAAFAAAKSQHKSLASVALLREPSFLNSGILVKKPGAGNAWIPYNDPRVNDVMRVHSPDGSAVDQLFVY